MSIRRVLVLLVLLAGGSRAGADAADLERSVQEVIKKAEPSIACLLISRSPAYKDYPPRRPLNASPGWLGDFEHVRGDSNTLDPESAKHRKLDMSHADYVPESFGSGIVIDSDGLILTNAHVVRGAVKVFVRLPGGVESYANIHALDTRSDLAVLKLINRPAQPLKPLNFGEGESIKKGQFVVALANPFAAGYRDGDPSASFGIVSSLRRRAISLPGESDRRRFSLHQFATLVMTDCRLTLGCSGGAIVNLKGELIGVTTSQAALSGVETPGGFALPLSVGVRRIIEVLQRGEEVEYGFLGVQFSSVTRGVQLGTVIKNSPADQAGLKGSDYILSAGGVPVRDVDDVFVTIGTMLAGNTVEVEHAPSLSGPRRKARVTLSKYHTLQPFIASSRPKAIGGLRVDHASLAVQRGGGFTTVIPEGVLIREVEPDSPADRASLQPDKIISHVNGKPVMSPREFYRVLADVRGDVELTVRKAEGGFDRVTLKLE